MMCKRILPAIAVAAGMSFAMASALGDVAVGIALGVGIAAAIFGGAPRACSKLGGRP